MAISPNRALRPRGGKYSVAGGANQVSYTNSKHTDGISMHVFPSELKDPERREWVGFVRKHRPHFTPSNSSVPCSAHFEESSFTTNLSISSSLWMKRKLKENAVPTIDVAGRVAPLVEELSERKRRLVC